MFGIVGSNVVVKKQLCWRVTRLSWYWFRGSVIGADGYVQLRDSLSQMRVGDGKKGKISFYSMEDLNFYTTVEIMVNCSRLSYRHRVTEQQGTMMLCSV